MQRIKEFLLINLGLLLVAAGIHLFKIPNNFVTGGVSGIAIIIKSFIPGLTVGPIMLMINILLLMIGFISIGFEFGSKTVYSSFALSGMVWLMEKLVPVSGPITDDKLLELVYSIMLPAVGSAIVFNQNASTGGTDIVAKILNRLTNVNIGKTLLMADFTITVLAGFVFGVKIGMYSALGLIMKGFLIDLVIEGINISKQVVVISEKAQLIKEYIINSMHRGVTVYKATGGYTNQEKEVVSVVLNRKQAIRLKKFIKEVDQKAFITVTNTSETIGKGFRSVDL